MPAKAHSADGSTWWPAADEPQQVLTSLLLQAVDPVVMAHPVLPCSQALQRLPIFCPAVSEAHCHHFRMWVGCLSAIPTSTA